jgi:hypothetical protein
MGIPRSQEVLSGGLIVLLLLFLSSPPRLPAQTSAHPSELRFDGVYQSGMKMTEVSGSKYTYWKYLRFYEDGSVAGVSSPDTPERLLRGGVTRSFDSTGRYTIKGSEIEFSLTSRQGTLDYAGSIEPDGLKLEWYSHINQRRAPEEYQFVPLAEATVLTWESGVRLEVIQPDRSSERVLANPFGQPSQVYSRDGLLLLEYEYDGAFLRVVKVRFYLNNTGQSGDYRFTATLVAAKTVSKDAVLRVESGKMYALEVPIFFGGSTSAGAGVQGDYSVRWVSSEKLVDELFFTVPAWDPEIKPLVLIPLEKE